MTSQTRSLSELFSSKKWSEEIRQARDRILIVRSVPEHPPDVHKEKPGKVPGFEVVEAAGQLFRIFRYGPDYSFTCR